MATGLVVSFVLRKWDSACLFRDFFNKIGLQMTCAIQKTEHKL